MLKMILKPVLVILNTAAVPYLEDWAQKSETPLDDLGIFALRLFCQVFSDGEVSKTELFQALGELLDKVGDLIDYYVKVNPASGELLGATAEKTRATAADVKVLALTAVWEK